MHGRGRHRLAAGGAECPRLPLPLAMGNGDALVEQEAVATPQAVGLLDLRQIGENAAFQMIDLIEAARPGESGQT